MLYARLAGTGLGVLEGRNREPRAGERRWIHVAGEAAAADEEEEDEEAAPRRRRAAAEAAAAANSCLMLLNRPGSVSARKAANDLDLGVRGIANTRAIDAQTAFRKETQASGVLQYAVEFYCSAA